MAGMVSRAAVPVPMVTVRTNGATVRLALDEAVAMGLVPGARVLTVGGRRASVSTETELWDGSAGFIPRSKTAGAITVDSSGNDAYGNASGANLLAIEYLDEKGYYRFATCALTGAAGGVAYQTTASGVGNKGTITISSTAASGIRVINAYVLRSHNGADTWGAANANAITVKIGGSAVAVIPAGANKAKLSAVSVPEGYVGFLTGIGYASDDELRGVVKVYAKAWNTPRQLESTFEISRGAAAAPISKPVRLGARSDFVLTATKSSGGNSITASTIIQVTILPVPQPSVFVDPNPELQPPEYG
jgi:hypothetical protein